MSDILGPSNKRFVFRTISPGDPLPRPFGDGRGFVCLIWDNQGGVADSNRERLATSLIAAGCRYAVCAGFECEVWHDAVDLAFLAQGLSEEEQDRRFVMTTWHDGESEDDVAFFFVLNTQHPEEEFDDYLVLQIGSDPQREARLRKLIMEYARGTEAA